MSDIPSEIFREILLRVPAEPLLRLRAVCKAWRRIIDDSSFKETHFKNEHSPTTLLIRNSTGCSLYSVSLDSINLDGSQIINAVRVKTLVRRSVPRVPDFPVTSCNGLILISNSHPANTWVIWNRLTREFHQLPKPDAYFTSICNGLGYDSAADDYKVVRVDSVRLNTGFVCRTFVYSLRLGSWKMIKDFPHDFQCFGQDIRGVFLNGLLYWKTEDVIIALDLGTEDYCQLPQPITHQKRVPYYFEDLEHFDALGGCLVFSYCYEECLDMWVMKDEKVEMSWTKLFSFRKQSFFCFLNMLNLKPIAYLKSKGQVLLQHDRTFFWLDIEKNSLKKITIRGLPNNFSFFSSQICPGSLFPLDQRYDVNRGVATKRRVQSKRVCKRLKIYVEKATEI